MPPTSDKRVKIINLKKVEIMNTLQDFEEFVKGFDADIDALQIPGRSEQLEELVREFNALRKEFNETVDDADAFDAMQRDRREFNKSTQANTTISAGTQPHLRLPKVDLPSFDGEITKWLTFKDRFSSMVHDSTDMPEVLKMQYLLSALKGDVARQFEHVQITSDNYSVTWEELLKRFDNTKELKREYFKAIFSLEEMSNDSTEELARVVNEACRLVRGLERLNEPVHTWDTPLSNLLFYKLDKKTLMAWEQHSVDDKTDDYKCLISFLEQRVNILKSSAQNVTNNIQTNSVLVTGKPGKRDGRYVALPVQQANIMKHGVAKCPMCSEQHHIQVCEQFVKLCPINREEVVRKFGLCFNCLRKGHSSRDCRSSFVCQQCKRKHHTKLCKMNKNSETEIASTFKLAAIAQDTESKKTVILSTAQVIILDVNNRPHKVIALLDNGSQLNFITESLAQALRLRRARSNEQIAGVGGVVMKVAGSVVGTIESLVTEYSACLEFLVLPKIMSDLPSQTINVTGWNIPKDVQLADPSFYERNPIDMLIGAETFVELIKANPLKLNRGLPTLLESELGWMVSGAYNQQNGGQSMACTVISQNDQDEQYWPNTLESDNRHETSKEEKCVPSVLTSVVEEPSLINKLCERVSSFTKLKRVVAYCFRFIETLKGTKHRVPYLEVCELRRAEIAAIRLVQREVYAKELECLKRGQLVMRTSSLKFINPVVDEDEVLRVGGRLSNADITDERRHPVIIPGRHRLAELIADKYHKILHHASLQLMLSTIQQTVLDHGCAERSQTHSTLVCKVYQMQTFFGAAANGRSSAATCTTSETIFN